jgi:hypothetical protein
VYYPAHAQSRDLKWEARRVMSGTENGS